MSETTMPAAEAAAATDSSTDERSSYELAFHVLPTVAEGEVNNVYDAIKSAITDANGEIFDEEAPERFELAYEIVQNVEGKNRKFNSTYFGWVRFRVLSEEIAAITANIDGQAEVLRHLLLKLTKVEEENPYRFHEALKDQKQVTDIDENKLAAETPAPSETVSEEAESTEETTAKEEASEKTAEVSETELDEALKKEEL
ncbi:30S ribosomal protein S6 [Candidatus Pacebacteria bacterium]|nr:30S ribosomal protein S6 [Candidatus Paceibacterota bacterium]